MSGPNGNGHYSVRELSVYLRITPRTVFRWLKLGLVHRDTTRRSMKRWQLTEKFLDGLPENWSLKDMGDNIMSAADVCKELHIHRTTVYRWFHEGLLGGFNIPGTKTLRLYRDDLEKLIAQASQRADEEVVKQSRVTRSPSLLKSIHTTVE